MNAIAWVCFIWNIVEFIAGIAKALIDEKTSGDRVVRFIVSLIWLMPIYFFYIYLLGGNK